MFTKIDANRVISDEGFEVKRISRNHIEYKEGTRKLMIEVELGDGLAIYISPIYSWTYPEENEIIKKKKLGIITRNISKALDFLNIKYVIC